MRRGNLLHNTGYDTRSLEFVDAFERLSQGLIEGYPYFIDANISPQERLWATNRFCEDSLNLLAYLDFVQV